MKKLIILTFIFNLFSHASFADNSPLIQNPVLTISEKIAGNDATQSIDFDMSMLESMPSHTLQTETTWSSGIQTFKGVLLKTLLDSVSSKGKIITAYALNDNQVDIPVSDIEKYQVIVAYQQNGKYMTVRNKGPLWIIYPESDYPELNRPSIKNRWVWQLREITVK